MIIEIIPTTKTDSVDITVNKNIILVPNKDKNDSMAKKLNRGIEMFLKTFPDEQYVCIHHDDAELKTPIDICVYKLDKLFSDKKIGIAGVIGTIALDRTCIWWSGVLNAGGRSLYGAGAIIQGGTRQVINAGIPQFDKKTGKPIIEPYNYWMKDLPGCHDFLATVDGCCMFIPRWILEDGLRFDEALSDYHFYDTDISLQVLERGYKVATVDIAVKHVSEGNLPEHFEDLRKVFFQKWDKKVHGEWPISRLSTFYKD